MIRHLLLIGLAWGAVILHPAGALASDVVPEWLVGSWRLMDVYVFHNTRKERKGYKRAFWDKIGNNEFSYYRNSVEFTESGIGPGGDVDLAVQDLGSSYGKWLPSITANSAFSGERLAISKNTTAVSVETSHCNNEVDRSDLGTSRDCTGTLVTQLDEEMQGHSRSGVDCDWVCAPSRY